MRQFTIAVSKCRGCAFRGEDSSEESYCELSMLSCREYDAYYENRNGLTPSCPMYDQSVEVTE
jgi:hypothetical protein